MSKVLSAFSQLPQPARGDASLSAIEFPGHSEHRIAKNDRGQPVVLIRTSAKNSRLVSAPLRTGHLHVVYSTAYKIAFVSGESGEEVFTSMTCLSTEASLIRYFLAIISGLLDSVGTSPSTDKLASVIRTVVSLFRVLTVPAENTVQGVWAELFLIATSRNKELVARAWHATPEERYDFMRGQERIEVKSSSRRQRRHHFSLEQLSPPKDSRLWIASVFTDRAGGGSSLECVLDMACAKLEANDANRVRQVAAETLGEGFESGLAVAFDFQLAIHSLQFYDSVVIPRPSLPLPLEISELRYQADLSRIPTLAGAVDDSILLSAMRESTESSTDLRL